MASICSVTLIEPNSAPKLEAIRPEQIKAVITGHNSLTMEIPTILGIQDTSPNSIRVGLVCNVSTKPMIKPVVATNRSDRFPTW